ncbi:uncharacterized protein LOC120120137 [Hibiscus syriacus]|uniref:uncharacterized protein LOC120120137 n=1 Tax=Hibiscus syriacus TaxID=106335 RepID=UPI0019205F15|nr:uncharacterized protein LOC120120137 [Hibiscus syriacus]
MARNESRNIYRIRCSGENSKSNLPTTHESARENVLLKVAWYGSELLGVADSYLRPPSKVEEAAQKNLELGLDGPGAIDRTAVVQTIKDDFEIKEGSYNTFSVEIRATYTRCIRRESFKGLRRFKRNCTNFGSLIEKSNMKLMKWEDFEDKGVGHWKFSCVMSFPWRLILSATGYTEYFFDEQYGKVCRYFSLWNLPKMALLKQLLRPTRAFWLKEKTAKDCEEYMSMMNTDPWGSLLIAPFTSSRCQKIGLEQPMKNNRKGKTDMKDKRLI